MLAGLGLRQLLDRTRQIIERFSRVLPALPQSIGALVELVGQPRVAAGDLLGGILQRIRQIVTRGLGELASLIGQRTQLLRRSSQVAAVDRFGRWAGRALVAQRIGQRLNRARVTSRASLCRAVGLRRLAGVPRRGLARLAGRLWLLRQLLGRILRASQRRQQQWAAGQIGEAHARDHPQPDRHQAQRHQRQHVLPGRLLAPRDPPVQQLGSMRGFHH